MAISIKNSEQIQKMRIAGDIVARTHELLQKAIRPGITTKELDKIAEDYIISRGATSNFKGYGGFPATICTSINDEVIHGIPGLRKLKDGDIISIDMGAIYEGFHSDAARTHAVGDVQDTIKKLMEVTKESFFKGLEFARAGRHLYEISSAIQEYVESFGFSVVRDYVGHGIGKQLHEDPQIPNYRMSSRGSRLIKGMTLAVEPMVNVGTHEIKLLADNWTAVTKDGKFSAHYENTFVITEDDPEILTI